MLQCKIIRYMVFCFYFCCVVLWALPCRAANNAEKKALSISKNHVIWEDPKHPLKFSMDKRFGINRSVNRVSIIWFNSDMPDFLSDVGSPGGIQKKPWWTSGPIGTVSAFDKFLDRLEQTQKERENELNPTEPNENKKPVANAGMDFIGISNKLITLNGAASFDPNQDFLEFMWTQTKGTPVTIRNPDSMQPWFIAPTVSEETAFTFKLTVTDPTGARDSDVVDGSIRHSDDQDPYLEILSPQNGAHVSLNGFTLYGTASDLGGISRIVVSLCLNDVIKIPGQGAIYDINTHQWHLTVDDFQLEPDTVGIVVVTAIDTDNHQSNKTIQVKIGSSVDNEPPIANAGIDQYAEIGTRITLDGSASYDPEQQRLVYGWTQTAGEIVELSQANTSKAFFTFPAGVQTESEITIGRQISESGTTSEKLATRTVAPSNDLVFRLVTNDGELDSKPDFVRISLRKENSTRPVANAGIDSTAAPGTQVNLDGSMSYDKDGNFLSYRWFQASGPKISLNSADQERAHFYAPQVSENTSYAFNLVVSDGKFESEPDQVVVLVSNSDLQLPMVSITKPANVIALSKSTTIEGFAWDNDYISQLTLSVYDKTTTYFSNQKISFNPSTNQWSFFVPENTFALTDELFIVVIAEDSSRNIEKALKIIRVEDAENRSSPVCQVTVPNQPAAPGSLVQLDASSSYDADGDPITFNWLQNSGPHVNLNLFTPSTPWFIAPESNTPLQFNVTVSDENMSSACSVSVTISDQPVDSTLPTISISQPRNHDTLMRGDLTVKGTAFDPSGIRNVAVSIYDLTRNIHTINNAAASYNADAHLWSYVIDSASLPSEGRIRLSASAFDVHENSSSAICDLMIYEEK